MQAAPAASIAGARLSTVPERCDTTQLTATPEPMTTWMLARRGRDHGSGKEALATIRARYTFCARVRPFDNIQLPMRCAACWAYQY